MPLVDLTLEQLLVIKYTLLSKLDNYLRGMEAARRTCLPDVVVSLGKGAEELQQIINRIDEGIERY